MTMPLLLFKATLLLSGALAIAWRLRSAAARHAVWSAAFVALLALPLLASAAPALRVPLPSAWTASPAAATPAAGREITHEQTGVAQAGSPGPVVQVPASARVNAPFAAAAPRHRLSAMALTRMAWLAGAAVAAGVLLMSLLRARRLARRAEPMADVAWGTAAAAMCERLGLRRAPQLLVSRDVRMPMAGGVWHPTVFLPAEATRWNAERRDIVLAHELSHLAGRDPLRHVAARLAVACYWFHPLAWLAARQATLAREQACDESVLRLGVRPSHYARVLLDAADGITAHGRQAPALPMIERSLLEERVMAILDYRGTSLRLRHPLLAAVGAAVFVVPLAAARPAPRPPAAAAPLASAPMGSFGRGLTESPRALTDVDTARASIGATPIAQSGDDLACWDRGDRGSFSGTLTIDDGSIVRRIGRAGSRRIVEDRIDDVRLCMIADDLPASAGERPSAWPSTAARVRIQSSGPGGSRVEFVQSGTAAATWRVNGTVCPFDQRGQAWRAAMLAVLDQVWDISTLRGEVSTLRGQISTIRGEESTLRGQISTLRGEVSTMRGEQSTVRGEESTLRGQISEIEGHVSSLQGEIASEEGAISSLTANRWDDSRADRAKVDAEIKTHQAEIERIEREIRDYDAASKIAAVEQRIRALDTDGKVAKIDDQIRSFDEDGKTAAIERQIQALDIAGKIGEIERRITTLDADRRTQQMEEKERAAMQQLEQAIAALR